MGQVRKAIITVCDSAATVAEAGLARWIDAVTAALASRHVARVALAGGRTPEALYRRLASLPPRPDMDWRSVQVFWGDERCVPPDHADSNYRMAREAFLESVPIPTDNVHRMRGELADAVAAAREYEDVLRRACRLDVDVLPRLDLCLLGLGVDGHTASLFPGTPAIRERRRWVMAGWVEKLASWRITLTPPVINNARHILFLVTGAEKAAAVRAMLEGAEDPDHLPVQIIRPTSGKVEYLLDREAASGLSPLTLHG